MSLNLWQGAEQEYASNSRPISIFQALGSQGVYVYTPLDNIPRAHLMNGGVCYIHSNLFEVCTPECPTPRQLVAYDKASEAYARLAAWANDEKTRRKTHLYKTNIALDSKGETLYTTVGAHENYLLERDKYAKKTHLLIPYLVLRQLFCGVGGYVKGKFMISPRTIFPLKVYSEVSTDYPIISLRDEPHAGEAYTRVHIVFGEGARSEITTFLKHSITSYVLQAITKGKINHELELSNPINSAKAISENLIGDWKIEIKGGKNMKAIELLASQYLEGIENLFEEEEHGEDDLQALNEFKWILNKLEAGLIESLDKTIEWVIKKCNIEDGINENFMIENGLEKEKEKITATHQYTAVTDPFFDELVESKNIKKLVSEKEVEDAFLRPPIDSRGQLRVSLAKHLQGKLDTLSWSYLKIKKGRKVLPYTFEDLEGWTKEKINQVIKDVDAL